MALDEPKDSDETYTFEDLRFAVDKQLIESSGGIKVDFVQQGYSGGYLIEPKIPFEKGPDGGECGSCCS